MSHFSRLADWLSWQETLHPRAIDLGLERLHRVLRRLEWQAPKCPVITIGGTNGKGSSVALLSRILACAGYRVGAFTSPHLVRYNERIVIAEREISDASLIAAFERIDAARDGETLTFFEFNALAALLVFDTANLDAIVLEVGMGGRLDAVNVVDPDVALITTIALDHCEWLGHDVEAIGKEKAGIFRAHRPAIFAQREMPHSIREHAATIGAQLLQLGHDFDFERSGERWSWSSTSSGVTHENLPLPALFGEMQFDNAAAVLQVLAALRERLPVSRAAIEAGLQSVFLTGRFQIFARREEWILDVAHNPAAAATFAKQLRALRPVRRSIAICGVLGDKDIDGIVQALHGCFDEWIVAGLSGARALTPGELRDRLQSAGASVSAITPSVAAACELARERAQSGDRVAVFGSFLTVGPALQWLQSEAA